MMFEDAFDYMKAATIRAAVNKSLEQGIVTEDLAAKEQPLIKQILELASRLVFQKYNIQKLSIK
jgi:isocitrate/isopropylmalate dehydrogenase